jgi:hypothetical protein
MRANEQRPTADVYSFAEGPPPTTKPPNAICAIDTPKLVIAWPNHRAALPAVPRNPTDITIPAIGTESSGGGRGDDDAIVGGASSGSTGGSSSLTLLNVCTGMRSANSIYAGLTARRAAVRPGALLGCMTGIDPSIAESISCAGLCRRSGLFHCRAFGAAWLLSP